jgi:hypothetical protein
MIKLKLLRKYRKPSYTIGKLFIMDTDKHKDFVYFCDTLEDTDRGLSDDMSVAKIKQRKVYGQTAIPTGHYKVDVTYSEHFKRFMPAIMNVKGFDGIRIHRADGPKGADLVKGCIGVGYNKIKGGLLNGKEVYDSLMMFLQQAKDIDILII